MMRKTYNIAQIEAVFELLVSGSSELKTGWEKHLREYYKDGRRERLFYFDMMEISTIAIKLFQQNKSEDLKLFFEKVETILNDADAEVTNLIFAGLIEGIQQICQYQNIDMRHGFDRWLLPETKKGWDAITQLFKHDEPF